MPLAPLALPLLARTFEPTRLRGLFGSLRDASPDFWGRRVIERNAGKARLTELDSLLRSPDEARAVLEQVEATVRDGWYREARRAGVTQRDCDALAGAFCYPGFRLPARG